MSALYVCVYIYIYVYTHTYTQMYAYTHRRALASRPPKAAAMKLLAWTTAEIRCT